MSNGKKRRGDEQARVTPASSPPAAAPAAGRPAAPWRPLYWWAGAAVFVLSLGLYVKTMAAGPSFWDSGEFIAAAYRLGIPHSPGTPLYVLVGRVFTILPLWFFTIAERVDVISALCGAAGIVFVYVLIVRFLDFTLGPSETRAGTFVKVAGGLVGALFLTFSDTYWTNATESEVYAMSNALMGFMIWLSLRWAQRPSDERSTTSIYLLFYLLALSVGFHLGTILAFSGIFFYVLWTRPKSFSNAEFLVACFGVAIFIGDATLYRSGQVTLVLLMLYAVVLAIMYARGSRFATVAAVLFVLGLSVHLYLLIRSMHNPVLDMGDPQSWKNLYAVLRREQYPPTNMFHRKATWAFQFGQFGRYFQAQFAMAAAYAGKLSLGALLPIGLGVWGIVDQFSKHKKTFALLFVTLVVVSLGLIVFLNFSDAEVRERDYFYSPAFYFFAVYIGLGAGSVLSELAALFRREAGRLAPATVTAAVVLVALPFFTLHHHYFTHDRSRDHTCDAYAHNMLVGLDKNAILFTNGDNDTFPLWYVQQVEGYRTDVRVVNLSLLNTPWYIEQCRDNPPKVPIAWKDAQIDRLAPVPTKDGWLLVRDLAVNHILQTNRFRQPVYFAVTIPPATFAPYRKYMEMQGLEYKVVPKEGDHMINVTRLEKNVYDNFDYESILRCPHATPDTSCVRDRTLHLPSYTEHLIQNYAVAFIELAYVQQQDSTFTKALTSMKLAYEIAPHMEPPRQLLGLYYLDAGDTTRAEQYYQDKLRRDPGDAAMMYRLAGVYERVGEIGKALDLIDGILNRDPTDRDLVLTAAQVALHGNMDKRARGYLTAWLARNPADSEMQKMLDDLDRRGNHNAEEPPR